MLASSACMHIRIHIQIQTHAFLSYNSPVNYIFLSLVVTESLYTQQGPFIMPRCLTHIIHTFTTQINVHFTKGKTKAKTPSLSQVGNTIPKVKVTKVRINTSRTSHYYQNNINQRKPFYITQLYIHTYKHTYICVYLVVFSVVVYRA